MALTISTSGQPRSSTSSRTNDRLQERLAKAIAAKSTQPSDARSVTSDSQSARPSADGGRPGVGTLQKRGADAPSPANTPAPAAITTEAAAPNNTMQDEGDTFEASKGDRLDSQRAPDSPERSRNSEAQPEGTSAAPGQQLELETAITLIGNRLECKDCAVLHAQVEALEARAEQSAKEQQEEMHHYVEQFESMQAKLQFLARDATDAARTSVAAATAGSHERILAERDMKITALMDEGRNLAATEQKHRVIIRKLRAQIAGDEKTLGELRARQEKLTADVETLRPRASRVEELEHSNQELQIKSNGMQDELSALRDEVSTNKSTMQRLRDDLRRASDQATSAVGKANEEALTAEKRRVKDLEDTVAALQLERSLIAGRAKESAAEAEAKVARAAERARAAELETKAELQAMEGKLEAMRALAEEASSGAVGDSQVKLLRQVETLQTQHAIAAENWQGIEASLVARVANLERERDDALRRESDMRKKARETVRRITIPPAHILELLSLSVINLSGYRQPDANARMRSFKSSRADFPTINGISRAFRLVMRRCRKEQRAPRQRYLRSGSTSKSSRQLGRLKPTSPTVGLGWKTTYPVLDLGFRVAQTRPCSPCLRVR